MVVEVILTVELVLTTKLTGESVGTFSMECLLVTLEMLVSSECLLAVGIITLAHGLAYNIV